VLFFLLFRFDGAVNFSFVLQLRMRMQRSTMYRHKKSLDLSTTMHSEVCQFVFPVDELTRTYAKTIPSDKNTIGRQEKVLDVNMLICQ